MAAGAKASSDVEVEVKGAAAARVKAIEDFQELAGLDASAAAELVDHALRAAVSQALETLSGENMVATTIMMSRAERLYYLTRAAKRVLTDEEVQVVFRCTPNAASTIKGNMNAVYASALWDMRKADMRSAADVELREDGDVLRITMPDKSTFEVLLSELRRLRITPIDSWPRRVDIPATFGDTPEDTRKALGL